MIGDKWAKKYSNPLRFITPQAWERRLEEIVKFLQHLCTVPLTTIRTHALFISNKIKRNKWKKIG